jgi:hypothetical protein
VASIVERKMADGRRGAIPPPSSGSDSGFGVLGLDRRLDRLDRTLNGRSSS